MSGIIKGKKIKPTQPATATAAAARGGVAGARGGVAGNLSAGTNTAGRDISFHKRDFTPEETNFFLYRTVFLYVCFGIPGIDGLLGVTIDALLLPNGGITDMQVKKMIWVVCKFNHYLSVPGISNAEEFIQLLTREYDIPNRDDTHNSIEIAKSIATLVVRVFVAFQMRINLGDGDGAAVAAEAPVAQNLLDTQQQADITAELNRDLNIEPALIVTEPNIAVDQTIGKIREGTEAPQRMSGRLRLLNEAIGIAAAEREKKAQQVKRDAETAKQIKIQEELARLQECIASFGQSIKFIEPIPAGIFKDSTPIKFAPPQFYKLLPKVLARIISCIQRRLVTTDIKPGPGTADTLNSLGLPDPSIKIKVDDYDGDQGGGSSSRSKRFGITKRKKNNKILRRLNSKNKKNPRKILYGGRVVRQIVEHAQPIPQCDHTIGNYHEYVNPTCYICGEPWIEGVQSSMECEHILCVIHGIEYYGLLQSVYLSEEQKNFLSILYAWAHRCCNQRKRNIAFIRKNPNQDPAAARGNYFVPDDVNIRELLSDIFTLSTYPDNKSKLDCNKILKKVRENKKQFVDKRTAVVTSYVTPLVACVNTVFTGLFAANMVLFNAIGCLKIIAEMSIYLTAVGKTAPELKLELGKTASFMSEIVFPGCEQQAVSANGGGGRRIIQDKKTRKLLRRKIQRGGAPQDIIDAISGLLAQEEYEKQMCGFKDSINIILDNPSVADGSSSGKLSDLLNGMFPSPPSPHEPQPVLPLPRLEAHLEPPTSKIDAILFILFVLNHSRNPTVLFGLFLNLKKQNGVIVDEQTSLARRDAQDEPEQVDVGVNITQSFVAYQAKRTINKTAFITICTSVFSKPDTLRHITTFLTACDMMPSFLGVVMFCERQNEFTGTTEHITPIIKEYMQGIPSPRFNEFVVVPQLALFKTNIVNFLSNIQHNPKLFTSGDVSVPTTPLDHLVDACYHLKQIDSQIPRSRMLLHACYLFPSCFDEDIFSQFGPCDAYVGGVLENHNFQDALGCVASAKTMCARILIEKLKVNPSKHSHDDQRVALELFYAFFDAKDQEILSHCYTGPPTPAMLQSHGSGGIELPTLQTGIDDIPSRITKAIPKFGTYIKYDADNFNIIIIGMMWENGTLQPGIIHSIDYIREYIRNQLLYTPEQFAESIAVYLTKNGNKQNQETLVHNINKTLFPIIMSRVKSNTEPVKVPEPPATVQKKPQRPSGRMRTEDPSNEGDTSHPQIKVVNKFLQFAKQLVGKRTLKSDDTPHDTMLFQNIQIKFGKLNDVFRERFTGDNQAKLDDINMNQYLSSVIALLLPEQSAPPSPSSDSSQTYSPPRQEIQPHDIAGEILNTYHYFQDESFEDDDIDTVYEYIMEPGNWANKLKYKINNGRQGSSRVWLVKLLDGGSSSHHTKRQHQNTRCKKQKIKSRRKNKYNTTKTRKNRNS